MRASAKVNNGQRTKCNDFLVRSSGLSIGLLVFLGVAIRTSGFDDKDNPQSPVEVYEWSVWVSNPAQSTINTTRLYKGAMPSSVGTSRPTIEEKDRAEQVPRRADLGRAVLRRAVPRRGRQPAGQEGDVPLRTGRRAPSAPAGSSGSSRTCRPPRPRTSRRAYLAENQWLHKLRDKDKALYLKHESHSERFIAYDAELAVSVPLKIRGGPDEYTLQNLTGRRLVDVVVIAPTDSGYRVGWLDELPTAAPEKSDESSDKDKKDAAVKTKEKKDAAKEKEAAKKTPEQKAEAVFADAEAAAKEKKAAEEELPPLPAEGDANVKARVDQVLNRPIVVTVDQTPRREVLDFIASQARIRYELDDRAIAKAEINLGQKMTLKSPNIAARDALAEVLGGIGLSYRVTEEGKLFITTAARLAETRTSRAA